MHKPTHLLQHRLPPSLEDLLRAGVTHVGRKAVSSIRGGRNPTSVSVLPAALGKATSRGASPLADENPQISLSAGASTSKNSTSRAEASDALEIIQAEVAGCTLCDELVRNRTQTVFGVGNPHPRLCFLGEAPGADEDRLGEPFVGAAGRKLNEIIEKGMGLRREDVYILNVVKCRPPGNRAPHPDEAANCRPFLDRQLALLRPEFICCLGAVAAQNLLDTTTPIGQMRGTFYDYEGIQVMCTYHPAYLLRNPSARAQVWEDIQMLMRQMGLERPQ